MFEAKFQTFDDRSDRDVSAARVAALREELARRKLDGFVVPKADRHQNEYLPASEERLAWLTAFTGSAGRAIVLKDCAALFVDGRYTLQARDQADSATFEVVPIADTTPETWIEKRVGAGARLGYDAWLHTAADVEKLKAACATAGAELIPVATDPFAAIWLDRPAPPLGAVMLHDIRHAGEDVGAKLERIRAEVASARADALVISNPANIAWTFNIRGADISHTPIAIAFAIVPREGRASLFIDGRKLSNAVRDAIETHADVREPDDFLGALASASAGGKTLRLDAASAAEALALAVEKAGGRVARGADPITQMKAIKNAGEIAGAKAAQLRDAAAIVRFLAWFDREAPKGELTEIVCVEALETFRRETGELRDVSFPTISGSGPNGAIVHYRVTRASDRVISPGELFLLDSGGQYLDGTTDITRTISVGEPTAEMRERFTRVLKGHIAIARAVFPEGVGGGQLDGFARQHLWAVGADYEHGTGHGVGSFLSVHEGPASIHKSNLTPLRRGMILSNEPGYYKTGAFGIRIENLVLVVAGPQVANADKPLNAFETLTLAPIDLRLVEPALMSAEEIRWLDDYHTRVRREVSPLVDAQTRDWLAAATAALA